MLFHKPDNPRKFIVKYLEEVKVSGTQPLLTEADLRTMFGMFDITKRGVMTPEQVSQVLAKACLHTRYTAACVRVCVLIGYRTRHVPVGLSLCFFRTSPSMRCA